MNKLLSVIILFLLSWTGTNAQTLTPEFRWDIPSESPSFIPRSSDYTLLFKSNLDQLYTEFQKSLPSVITALPSQNINYSLKDLNDHLISGSKHVEHTFRDINAYLRGCGPLTDGIQRPLNSGDLMLSMIIDNFVNTVLLKGKGPFSLLLNSRP